MKHRSSSSSSRARRAIRHRRVRAQISGSTERPRLAVFRSSAHISAQLIDDTRSVTVIALHDTKVVRTELSKAPKDMNAKMRVAYVLGRLVAEEAQKQGITKAVFDRGGFAYHGRVKALADGARAGGLEF